MQEARWESRRPKGGQYIVTGRSTDGRTFSMEARGLDLSRSGIGLECASEFKVGSIVHVRCREGSPDCDCEVVHCTVRGAKFHIGCEFREEAKPKAEAPAAHHTGDGEPDYYDILQISRKADLQTINRVFRLMAVRFHPDNPETGDVEQFLRMKQAYTVLSDPERRREYDARIEEEQESGPRPIFGLKDFVVGVEAEANRRLGVLAILYRKRQTTPDHPGVSLLDLEGEMGFPREYLSFTTWYLVAKAFITIGDNSDYTLTAAGADYVEKKALRNEMVDRLLNKDARRVRFRGKTGASRAPRSKQLDRHFLLPSSSPMPMAD